MAKRQATSKSLKSIAGASLLAVGLVLFFANLDWFAVSLDRFAGISSPEAVGILPALSLAALHSAQAYAFDHRGFISGFLQILVSFWPSILIAIGAALLRNALGPLLKPEVGETSSGQRAWQ